jgi:predicted ATP-dependent protease
MAGRGANPSRNLAHLLLDDEVIEAVNSGQFHLYPVSNVLEAIERLTDVPAGNFVDGRYPDESVLGRAQASPGDVPDGVAA